MRGARASPRPSRRARTRRSIVASWLAMAAAIQRRSMSSYVAIRPTRKPACSVREAARRVLRGQLSATGFVSPVQAFGARELLAAQAEEGYLSWEVRAA